MNTLIAKLIWVAPVLMLVSSTAWSRPRGCGPQYNGPSFIDCHTEQGSEAVPEVCHKVFRDCNGIPTSNMVVCTPTERGSTRHQILSWVCNNTRSSDGLAPLPSDLDPSFYEVAEIDPVVAYPDVKEFDFPNDGIAGPVKAHRHPNGRGLVADSVVMADPASIYIAPEAMVYDKAVLGKDVFIMGRAQVYGTASILSGSFVGDQAKVSGKATLRSFAGALGDAQVTDSAALSCGGMALESSTIVDSSRIEGYDWKTPGTDCDGYAMSEKPGVASGDAMLAGCAVVGAGGAITSGYFWGACR